MPGEKAQSLSYMHLYFTIYCFRFSSEVAFQTLESELWLLVLPSVVSLRQVDGFSMFQLLLLEDAFCR